MNSLQILKSGLHFPKHLKGRGQRCLCYHTFYAFCQGPSNPLLQNSCPASHLRNWRLVSSPSDNPWLCHRRMYKIEKYFCSILAMTNCQNESWRWSCHESLQLRSFDRNPIRRHSYSPKCSSKTTAEYHAISSAVFYLVMRLLTRLKQRYLRAPKTKRSQEKAILRTSFKEGQVYKENPLGKAMPKHQRTTLEMQI